MDPAEYTWSNQNSLVSSLDLLEEEVSREASNHGSQWNRDKYLLVEGEPAATIPREITRISPRKPSVVSKTPSRRRLSTNRGSDRSANNAEEDEGPREQLRLENERLRQAILHLQREVEHVRAEKLELEASFRRLDQEIGTGYHLRERKEKEIRISELVTKNQKVVLRLMSQLLEKELKTHEELRQAHAESQGEKRKLTEQVTLLNQVLDSVESKHAELSSSYTTLTSSYEAAQTTIEALQSEVHSLQEKLATSAIHVQFVTEYEEKIQQWERACRELEHKCDSKTQKLMQLQKITSATQQEAQKALDRQEKLEQEVASAHDQMIHTNAAMRTMEAKMEAKLKAGNHESLHRRIHQLEGELLLAKQGNAALMQTCNQILGSQNQASSGKGSLSARNGQTMASRVAKLTTRITSLTDKLRSTEEASDRKNRSLDILMQAFPFLLHRLDGMQDQLAAAVESNDIMKSALAQTQGHGNDCSVGGSMYLHLARDKYILEAPYPIELLTDQTGVQALTGYPESTNAKKKRFSPFRVTCSALKLRDNQLEEENGNQMHQLVVLAADSSDVSGASYLNRSKINAFLEVIQSSAARNKFKTLVIGKLAECLNKLRELAHRSASEAATKQASIQVLQREVANLRQQLKNGGSNNQDGSTTHSIGFCKTRQFLLKMVDIYAEKQQEYDHHQMTFLTQPLSSDVLITKDQSENSNPPDDRLYLADCGLEDDDVAQLLLKIVASGVRFREIILDSNNLSDFGAQHIAGFLEKSPASVRVMSLAGNKRITSRGVNLIKGGLLRNQRVQRVKEDECDLENGVILRGLAIQQDFDITGYATETLRVVLPRESEIEEVKADLQATTPEAVDAMTEKLRQLGFRYNIRKPPVSTRQRSSTYSNNMRAVSQLNSSAPIRRSSTGTNIGRRAPVPSSSDANASRRRSLPSTMASRGTNNRCRQIKQQQDERSQSLEAAIGRASTSHSRRSLTSAPINSRPSFGRSVNGSTTSAINKRTFSKSHVNTIRGLRR